jgi:hypothetical protein
MFGSALFSQKILLEPGIIFCDRREYRKYWDTVIKLCVQLKMAK